MSLRPFNGYDYLNSKEEWIAYADELWEENERLRAMLKDCPDCGEKLWCHHCGANIENFGETEMSEPTWKLVQTDRAPLLGEIRYLKRMVPNPDTANPLAMAFPVFIPVVWNHGGWSTFGSPPITIPQ